MDGHHHLWGGLVKEEDFGVCGGGFTLPCTKFPSWGTSSELEAGKTGGSATQPLDSRGSPNKGTKSQVATSPLPSQGPTRGRKYYVIPAFTGVPKQVDKITSGCLTTAFSGADKWAEVLRHPCILGPPHTRGKYQNWPPQSCLLVCPQVGGRGTYPMHSWGSLNKGTKSEVAISPLPSRGRTSGRKHYTTGFVVFP